MNISIIKRFFLFKLPGEKSWPGVVLNYATCSIRARREVENTSFKSRGCGMAESPRVLVHSMPRASLEDLMCLDGKFSGYHWAEVMPKVWWIQGYDSELIGFCAI